MFRSLIVFAVLICALSAVGVVSAGNSAGMGNYGSLLDITVKAPPSEPLGAPQPQVRGDTSQPSQNEFLQMLIPFFLSPETIETKRMTVTGTLQGWVADPSNLLVASEVSHSQVPSTSALSDPNDPSLVTIQIINTASSGVNSNVIRLGYASDTADTAFPDRITITNGTYSLDLSGGPQNITTRGLGKQGDWIVSESAIGSGKFNAGDNITLEMYDVTTVSTDYDFLITTADHPTVDGQIGYSNIPGAANYGSIDDPSYTFPTGRAGNLIILSGRDRVQRNPTTFALGFALSPLTSAETPDSVTLKNRGNGNIYTLDISSYGWAATNNGYFLSSALVPLASDAAYKNVMMANAVVEVTLNYN